MPKYQVDSLADVPEPLRPEYEQRDGKYFLKTDVPLIPASELAGANGKLAEFRDNNRKLMRAIGAESIEDALDKVSLISKVDREKLERALGIDLDQYEQLVEKSKALEKKGVKQPDDIQKLISDAITQAMGPVNAKLEELTASEAKAQQQLAFRNLENHLTQIALKAGANEKALPDLLNRALEIFDLDGVARDGDTPIYSVKDPTKPLTADEWVAEMLVEAPHLFKTSGGGGVAPANGPNGPIQNRPGVKELFDPTPQQLGQYAKQISKGEIVVRSSGQQ